MIAIGLRAQLRRPLLILRRPQLALRAVLAMYVAMPLVALLLASAAVPQHQPMVLGTVLLSMLTALLLPIPFERWRRQGEGAGRERFQISPEDLAREGGQLGIRRDQHRAIEFSPGGEHPVNGIPMGLPVGAGAQAMGQGDREGLEAIGLQKARQIRLQKARQIRHRTGHFGQPALMVLEAQLPHRGRTDPHGDAGVADQGTGRP